MIGQTLAAAGQAAAAAARITPQPPVEGATPQLEEVAGAAQPAAAPTPSIALPPVNFPQRDISQFKAPEERTVYDDLPERHLWLRDEIAKGKLASANSAHYFDPSRLALTNKDLELQAQERAREGRFYDGLQGMKDENLQVDLLDPKELTKPLDELKRMLREIPPPPRKADMEAPSWMQSVASLVAALVDPTNAAAYAAAPLQYQMQRREEQYQQDMLQYDALKQKLMMEYQLESTRAEQLANIAVANNRLQNEARFKWLDKVYQARMADATAADQWDRTVFSMQVDLMKMDRQTRQAITLAHLDMLTSGRPSSPEQRAAAAALIAAQTGVTLQTSEKMTPAEVEQAERVRQMILTNNFTERTEDARVRTIEAGAQTAESGAVVAGVEARTAEERTKLAMEAQRLANENAALANKYLPDEKQAQLNALLAQTTGQQLQNNQAASNAGEVSDAQRKLFTEAALEAKGNAGEKREALAKRKSEIIGELKEGGQWLEYGHKEGGFLGVGANRLSNEEVDARNQKLLADRLRQDPLATELERSAREFEADAQRLEGAANARSTAPSMNPVGMGDLGKRYQDKGLQYSMTRRNEEAFTDCSEFTQCVYRDMGKQIPPTAATQWTQMTPVAPGQQAVGDLVFFRDTKPSRGRQNLSAHHVGVIIGFTDDGTPIMRHASSAANKIVDVALDKYLSSTGGRMQLLGVRR